MSLPSTKSTVRLFEVLNLKPKSQAIDSDTNFEEAPLSNIQVNLFTPTKPYKPIKIAVSNY